MPGQQSIEALQQRCSNLERDLAAAQLGNQRLTQRLVEAKRLLQWCKDTGGLRKDSTRPLWDDINDFLNQT